MRWFIGGLLLISLGGCGNSLDPIKSKPVRFYTLVERESESGCDRYEHNTLSSVAFGFEWEGEAVQIPIIPVIMVFEGSMCFLRFSAEHNPCFGYIELVPGEMLADSQGDRNNQWTFRRSEKGNQIERLSEEVVFSITPGTYAVFAAWHQIKDQEENYRLDYVGTRYGEWMADDITIQ